MFTIYVCSYLSEASLRFTITSPSLGLGHGAGKTSVDSGGPVQAGWRAGARQRRGLRRMETGLEVRSQGWESQGRWLKCQHNQWVGLVVFFPIQLSAAIMN